MSAGWIVLGVVAWALGVVFVIALVKMSGDQDRTARHEEKRLNPNSDVTITQVGEGKSMSGGHAGRPK